jgi:glycosyltransferase involved in cell wall biosynthesis
MRPLILTIAIPFYNGLDKISNILSNLYKNENSNYEILLIDDCSYSEQTEGLLNLINNKYNNGNLRYLYNNINLGMDANFEKCIFESYGKYIWFFGQDDYVVIDDLNYCIECLEMYNPDIVFANYSINRSWKYNSNYVFNNNTRLFFGVGVSDFLKISNRKVPSFLPSLIIKKDVWPSDQVISKFYGTHFIQLASFIYNLLINKKWLYIGKPLAIGEIPATGWQNSLVNRIKYYVGFVSCLNNFYIFKLPNSNLIIHEQLNDTIIQHLLLSIECKIAKQNDLLEKLMNPHIFPYKNILISKIIYYTPIPLLLLIQFNRNIYYKYKNSIINEK